MWQSFSKFSLAAVVVLAMAAGGQERGDGGQGTGARGQEPGVRSQGSATNDAPRTTHHSPLTSPLLSGQELIEQAARRVNDESAIWAELRYRISAFGHQLAGTGTYLQLGSGREKLLKLELRMAVGQRPATLQEIRGEDFYWVRRDLPPNPPSLSRVNLRQLRQSLSQPARESADGVLPQGSWIMLGGLPQLMTALARNFAFEPPRADELQFRAADGGSIQRLPIWVVAGRWKPERLAVLLGRDPGKARELPEQLPDRVELVLGRTEEVLPLFPYRITYWRTPKADAKAAQADVSPAPRELLTLELFNVARKGDIDRREFLYNPGDQEVIDLTARYIERLGGETKVR